MKVVTFDYPPTFDECVNIFRELGHPFQDDQLDDLRAFYNERLLTLKKSARKYSEDQPRDDHGEWTDGGGDSGGTATGSGGSALDHVPMAGANDQSIDVANAEETVLQRSRKDNNEHGAIVDAEHPDTKVTYITSGLPDGIRVDKTPEMMDPSRNLTFVHNHPASTSLSPDDLAVMVSAPGIKTMEAIGADGSRYVAQRGPNTPAAWQTLANAAREAGQSIYEDINPQVRAGKIPAADASMMHWHAVNAALAQNGLIKYSAHPGALLKRSLANYKQPFDAAMADAIRAVHQALPRPNASDGKAFEDEGAFYIDDTPPVYGDGKNVKYSESQPRDDHGRFSDESGGGDASAPVAPPHVHESTGTLVERLSHPDAGFTVSTVTGSEPNGPGHFAVSIYPEAGKVFDQADMTPKALYSFTKENKALLSRPDHYLGGWHDPESGKIYLDVSVVTKDRQQAEALARSHNQLAYFDFGSGKSVRVEPGSVH